MLNSFSLAHAAKPLISCASYRLTFCAYNWSTYSVLFCFLDINPDTLSSTPGTMLTTRSAVVSAVWICSKLTLPLLTTKNAKGEMVTPPPEPPPKGVAGLEVGNSDPPVANPKDTFETGIMVVPSSVVIGFPTMVLTSISFFKLARDASRMSFIGLCSIAFLLFPVFTATIGYAPKNKHQRFNADVGGGDKHSQR